MLRHDLEDEVIAFTGEDPRGDRRAETDGGQRVDLGPFGCVPSE